MSILYFDCFSGISGDMILGALLDAGLQLEWLNEELHKLPIKEFRQIRTEQVLRGAIAATLMHVEVAQEPVSRHRHLSDISDLILDSDLAEEIKQTSLQVFSKLAAAEARVHGISLAEVHFHEVGAVDSIVDIVGAAAGLHYLNIHQVYASALPLGSGRIQTEHGWLPLPAPATLELLRMANAPVAASEATVELVTPTGAAFLASQAIFSQPAMCLVGVGVGAGQRELDWPNVLRVLIGEPDEAWADHIEMDTNIDDMSPQLQGHVMAVLFEAGALDVYFTPIFMKKNRPAVKLSVIAFRKDEKQLADILLQETSTFGIRIKPVSRVEAAREMRLVATRFGDVPVKCKLLEGRIAQTAPEFDACAKLAKDANVPVQRVLQEALSQSQALIGQT